MRRTRKVALTQLVLLMGGAGALEVTVRFGMISRSTLTPVSEMLITLWKSLFTDGVPSTVLTQSSVADSFLITLSEILLSFVFAVLAGFPIGILLWRYKALARILNPYLVSYYAIPVFALYPVIVGVFGVGMLSITFMGWLFAIVAIIIHTATGFGEVDKRIYPRVARSLRLSRTQIFFSIYLPGATPYIFTGFKLGFVYSIIGVAASEFILSTKGLGHLIRFSYEGFETEIMYAAMLLIIFMAVVFNSALTRVERLLYGRQPR